MDSQVEVAESEVNNQEDMVLEVPANEMVGFDVLCRLCANQNEKIIGIYSEEGISNDLAKKMNLYLPIKVSEMDTLPLQCCWTCASTVLAWHELVIASVEADRRFRSLHVVPVIKTLVDEEDNYTVEDDVKVTATEDIQEEEEEDIKGWELEFDGIEQGDNCIEVIIADSDTDNSKSDEREVPIEYKSKYSCQYCNQSFETGADKLRHSKVQHANLRKHIKSTMENKEVIKYHCALCSKKYSNKLHLVRHRLLKHPKLSSALPHRWRKINSEEKDLLLICTECKEIFENRESLLQHLEYAHDIVNARKLDEQGEIEQHFCDICLKGFRRRYDMHKHRDIVHKDVSKVEKTLLLDSSQPLLIEPKPKKDLTEEQRGHRNVLQQRCKVTNVDNTVHYQCDICTKIFKRFFDLVRHHSIHTGVRPFVCHLCGKSFRLQDALRYHISYHHNGIKNFCCEICDKRFVTKQNMEQHMNIHTGNRPYKCNICSKSFKQRGTLRAHKVYHSKDYPFICEMCGKKFRFSVNLKNHILIHTECKVNKEIKVNEDLLLTCSECNETFPNTEILLDHLENAHIIAIEKNKGDVIIEHLIDVCSSDKKCDSSKEDIPIARYFCDVCSKCFTRKYDLNRHRLSIHSMSEIKESICNDCGKPFPSKQFLREHLKNVHEKVTYYKRGNRILVAEYFCDICKRGYTRKYDVIRHKLQVHNKDEFGKIKNELDPHCDQCDEVFSNKEMLIKHLKNVHNIVKYYRRKTRDIVAKYFCDLCGKGFTRKYDAIRHRNVQHLLTTPQMQRQKELSPEEKQMHEKLQQKCKFKSADNTFIYKCDSCPKIFKRFSDMLRHYSVHTGVCSYICHICGKSFRLSSGLRHHLTLYHEGVKKYACEYCEKRFVTKQNRDQHTNIHTGDRPFVCDLCGKSFKQKSALRAHKAYHSQKRPFICVVCNKTFVFAAQLKNHSEIHTGYKPHVCQLCGATFRLKNDLNRHLNCHDRLNECICNVCGMKFKQQRYLTAHMRKHKEEKQNSSQIRSENSSDDVV